MQMDHSKTIALSPTSPESSSTESCTAAFTGYVAHNLEGTDSNTNAAMRQEDIQMRCLQRERRR